MASQSYKKVDIIIARSKRTTQKYPARTSQLTSKHTATSSLVAHPHYVDGSHSQACRCLTLESHDRPWSVRVGENLVISVTRYTDKFDPETRSLPEFDAHLDRQKIESAVSHELVEHFHYSGLEKNVVCRCNISKHNSCRRVQNQEIRKLCAKFFQLNTTTTTCTRKQWRAVDDKIIKPPKRSLIQSVDSVKPVRNYSASKKEFLQSDSPLIELLKNQKECLQNSCKHPSHESSGPCTYHSMKNIEPQDDMSHFNSGSTGKSDIPENVWRNSRPSAHLERNDTGSLMSTPLGSSATPILQNEYFNTEWRAIRPSEIALAPEDCQSSLPTSLWSDYTQIPSSSQLGNLVQSSRTARMVLSPSFETCPYGSKIEVSDLEATQHTNLNSLGAPEKDDRSAGTQTIDDFFHGTAVELDATPSHSWFLPHPLPALHELESGTFNYIFELGDRQHSN